MYFDLFSGFSTLALKKPNKPVLADPLHEICLNTGENEGQYRSFVDVIGDLAQAFKFLSDDKVTTLKNKYGTSYENLDFSMESSQWDPITGAEGGVIDSFDFSILEDINSYFDWDAIKSIGSSQSYYQIANGGAIGSFSDEDAFNFMCSMVESKERVFGRLESIFGDSEGLTNDEDVISHITSFMDNYTDVDPHNMVLLSVFFDMQTDFINALDAYMNCQTYWGGDGTSNLLMGKVDGYISTLSGEQKDAAVELESMWINDLSRWDKVGDTNAKDLAKTDGSWVKFFQDKMDEAGNEDAVRTIVCSMLNRSADQKYRKEEAQYEAKKDDLIQDEIWSKRMEAKARAESKKSFNKLAARSASASRSQRAAGLRSKKSASGIRARAAVKRTIKAPAAVRRAPVITGARPAARSTPSHLAVGPAARRTAGVPGMKSRPSASMGANAGGSQGKNQHAKVQPKVQSQASQAQKHAKDEKKVI